VAETSDRDRAWEEFLEVWCELRELAAKPGTVVVVEGERDRASLAALQIRENVVALHRGRPLGEVAHRLSLQARTVVILTDWDTAGGQLARRLRVFLEAMPLTLDLDSRRRLSKAVRGEVAHVEGLAGWARRSADRAGTTVESALAEAELGRRSRRRPTG
jgi:5S rRNA maturation endonuclease (ribonuclease M5)